MSTPRSTRGVFCASSHFRSNESLLEENMRLKEEIARQNEWKLVIETCASLSTPGQGVLWSRQPRTRWRPWGEIRRN